MTVKLGEARNPIALLGLSVPLGLSALRGSASIAIAGGGPLVRRAVWMACSLALVALPAGAQEPPPPRDVAAPEPAKARIEVATDPPEAAVYVHYPDRQERFLGRTPAAGALALELEAGAAEVVVVKDGFVCKVEPLELEPGAAARLELRLAPDVEIPRGLVLKSAVPFVRDAREGEKVYRAVLQHVNSYYVDEVDPRALIDGSVRTLVEILNAVRAREHLLRRELPPEARRRYYGEELDLRDYPRLVLERGAADDDGRRSFALGAGTIGIEGLTDDSDPIDSYMAMLLRVWGFVRHKWDVRGLLSDSLLTRCLVEGLLEQLGDAHTSFLDPADTAEMAEETAGSFGGVGLVVAREDGRLVVVAPMPGTPAERAGIQAGDWIVAIDGQATDQMQLRRAVTIMRGEVDTPVELRLRRGDEELTRTLLRARVLVRAVASRLLPGKDGAPPVGYVRISTFMHEELEREVRDAVLALKARGAGAFVLDLRANPGGLLSQAWAVANLFVREGTIVSTRSRLPGQSRTLTAEPGPKLDTGPLAVLIDGQSASASEILAGTLHDLGLARLVGTRSYGKGSVQRVIPLQPFSCALALTVATYHLPSGETPHGKGVTPDVVVELSEEEAVQVMTRSNYTVEQEAVDPQLQAALDLLR